MWVDLPVWYDQACIVNSVMYGLIGVCLLQSTGDVYWKLVILSGVISATFRSLRLFSEQKCDSKWGAMCNPHLAMMFYLDLLCAFLVFYVVGKRIEMNLYLPIALLMGMAWILWAGNRVKESSLIHTVAHGLGTMVLFNLYVTRFM